MNFNSNPTNFSAQRQQTSGFSLIELMVVLVIIGVLMVMALPYVASHRRLYKSEDQALRIMDLMRETAQLALVKNRTFRFEIDKTDNKIYIIDENGTGAADDFEIKAIPLAPEAELRVDRKPDNVNTPNPPNYGTTSFATDTIGHKRGTATITGHNVWAARFKSNGSVVNAANTVTSNTLYVWEPVTAGSNDAKNKGLVRAITLFGGSGAIRYWEHNNTTFSPR